MWEWTAKGVKKEAENAGADGMDGKCRSGKIGRR